MADQKFKIALLVFITALVGCNPSDDSKDPPAEEEETESPPVVEETPLPPLPTLNDTGLTECSDYAATDLNAGSDSAGDFNVSGSALWQGDLDCEATGASETSDGQDNQNDIVRAGQDALIGRDVHLNDDSDGRAGFSFSKLDTLGEQLPDQTLSYTEQPWDCVLDNVTGLMWEVKTPAEATDMKHIFVNIHGADNVYKWYSTDTDSNGGIVGSESTIADRLDTCHYTSARCDTEQYVEDVNDVNVGLCGFHDWRLPTAEELLSIHDLGSPHSVALDVNFFPHTVATKYWTATPQYKGDGVFDTYDDVQTVNSSSGLMETISITHSGVPPYRPIRLVRSTR